VILKGNKEKILLAYSGGLDTSVILKWLLNHNYDVVCCLVDVGQKEDFAAAKKKALSIGASNVYIEDAKKEFIEEYIFQALKANAIYEGKYLLGTSLARPVIVKKLVKIAKQENINIVAHGATGKGNDQVRFELGLMQLLPGVKIISPWKEPEFLEQFKGRTDLINYAKKNNIPITSTLEKPYSMDDNLMHISYEGGILEDPKKFPANDMCKWVTDPKHAPDKETDIIIEFKKGIPVKVINQTENKSVEGALELFNYLNELGAKNGIGKTDIVENRFVGMKSRGVYETPGGTILWKAHLDIEGITLDKEVAHLKDMLMPKIAALIYNGFWFSPEMKFLMSAVNQSQENVEGKVYMTIYKGNVMIKGRESAKSLYSTDIASMDKLGGYDQTDAKGFIKINALRLMLGGKNETVGKGPEA
jgi:argininosuccinate synthase